MVAIEDPILRGLKALTPSQLQDVVNAVAIEDPILRGLKDCKESVWHYLNASKSQLKISY